jgi:hypothetical protein
VREGGAISVAVELGHHLIDSRNVSRRASGSLDAFVCRAYMVSDSS